MQSRTKRRAFLGGLAIAGVGGAGYLLRQPTQQTWGRWLYPATDITTNETFAFVRGVVDDGLTMDVQVAMRQTAPEERTITLFADSDDPVQATMSSLWGFWRFDVQTRQPGTYVLDVAGDRLEVELEAQLPTRLRNPRLRLTPRALWQSPYVAHARAIDTGPETGRMHVDFRQQTGSDSFLDSLQLQTPAGDVVASHPVPDGVYQTAFDIEPFRSFEADARLLGIRGDDVVDDIELFYH